MRDIIRKIGIFFEAHVEKVVLGVVGVICMVLLYMFVIFSPNAVVYDGNKYSPAEIDHYIEEQAAELRAGLNREPELVEPYSPRLHGALSPDDPVRQGIPGELKEGFTGLFSSALDGIVNEQLFIPLPSSSLMEMASKREYRLPRIGEVSDVAVEHIRAVAYVPTEEVDEKLTYDGAGHEVNDIDLVTVEAKYDVAALYSRFHESFASEFLPEQWRDPCLAVPVFAAVQLQRQELLDDGSWSEWYNVPRSRIDHHRKMFEIVEDVDQLRGGGIKVRLLQFNNPEVRMDLLQPQAYQIASAKEEWFPPTMHTKYIEQRKKEELEEKRVAREEEREERRRELEEKRGDRFGGRSGGTRPSTGMAGRSPYADIYGGGTSPYGDRRTRRSRTDRGTSERGGLYDGTRLPARDRTSRRRSRDSRDTTDMDYLYMSETSTGARTVEKSGLDKVYDEFYEVQLDYRTNPAEMEEPLLFWAHDDTVEPLKSYRYRIRLGVFNPVAGTKHVSEQDLSKMDQVILWSEFSDVTEQVTIPGWMYFFAQDIQETAKTVTVEVAKYVLGYWYSQEFLVNPGEVIGKEVKNETQESEFVGRAVAERYGTVTSSPRSQFGDEPDVIDYNTGAIMVDAVLVNDWLGSGVGQLSRRNYFNVLYSFDGMNIEQMPIKPSNWSAELLAMSNEIKRVQKEEKEPLRAWDSSTRRRRGRGALEGYEGMAGSEYEMMLQQMMAD